MTTHKLFYKEKFDPTSWSDLYGEQLRPYAKRNFKGFVSILFYLLKEKREQFDLIIGVGMRLRKK